MKDIRLSEDQGACHQVTRGSGYQGIRVLGNQEVFCYLIYCYPNILIYFLISASGYPVMLMSASRCPGRLMTEVSKETAMMTLKKQETLSDSATNGFSPLR